MIPSATNRPGKVIGMHFMNPVPVMKLVKIINGYATEQQVTEQIVEATKVGESALVVNEGLEFLQTV